MGKRIIVALDVSSETEALRLAEQLVDQVAFFKVGLELLTAVGPSIINKITALGCRIFYDGKFHDIPNTVSGASREVARLGVGMFNVHAMGGGAMMRAASEAASRAAVEANLTPPKVIAVTVLTSLDKATFGDELRLEGEILPYAVHLARLAHANGLDGVVCSPQEVEAIRAALPDSFLTVTPGIRPEWAAAQDQRRVMTPGQAVAAGASYIVIGRPITNPPQRIGKPSDAAMLINAEIERESSR